MRLLDWLADISWQARDIADVTVCVLNLEGRKLRRVRVHYSRRSTDKLKAASNLLSYVAAGLSTRCLSMCSDWLVPIAIDVRRTWSVAINFGFSMIKNLCDCHTAAKIQHRLFYPTVEAHCHSGSATVLNRTFGYTEAAPSLNTTHQHPLHGDRAAPTHQELHDVYLCTALAYRLCKSLRCLAKSGKSKKEIFFSQSVFDVSTVAFHAQCTNNRPKWMIRRLIRKDQCQCCRETFDMQPIGPVNFGPGIPGELAVLRGQTQLRVLKPVQSSYTLTTHPSFSDPV